MGLVVRTFLSAGVDINQQTKKLHGNYSALHFAVDYPENFNLVKLLVENGIDIELENEHETFTKPDWLGEEVTGINKYYNSNLSKLPFFKW